MRILLNGRNLNIEQYGPEKGPTVVLLHHGLGSIKAWRGQAPALVEAGFRVIAYDRWGYGDSDDRPSLDLPTFSDDLDDLGRLLKELAIPQVALVGHSDGGTIALYYSAQFPGQVSCLVTVAAHIYVELEMEPGFLGIHQAFVQDERFRMGMQYAHGEKYERVFHNWFDGWNRLQSLDWDMRPVLGQIRCPALIVQGEEDEYATPQHARDIAGSIQGAKLWLIHGASHMVPQENCVEFNLKIVPFLKAHTTNSV